MSASQEQVELSPIVTSLSALPTERNRRVFKAADGGDTVTLERELDVGDLSVNACTSRGVTLVMLALKRGRVDTARMLVQRGASLVGQDKFGLTVLMYAARSGEPEAVSYVLETLLETLDAEQFAEELHRCNSSGLQAITFAARHAPLPTVMELVEHGADVDHIDGNGWTLEQHAARGGNVEMLRYLMRDAIVSRATPVLRELDDARWEALVNAGSRRPDQMPHGVEDFDEFEVLHFLIDLRPVLSVRKLSELHWKPEWVEAAAQKAVAKSGSPMLLCLRLYEAFSVLAETNANSGWQDAAERFTDVALRLHSSIPSDHFAAWALESRSMGMNNEAKNAIDCALRSHNYRFIASERVARITNFWFRDTFYGYLSRYGYLPGIWAGQDTSLLTRFLFNPKLAFSIPAIRYAISSLFFIFFLLTLVVTVFQQPSVVGPFRLAEELMYAMTLGYILEELGQIAFYPTFFRYCMANVSEIIYLDALAVSFVCRILLQQRDFNEEIEGVYLACMAVSAVMVSLRSIFVLRHFEFMSGLTALVTILQNIAKELRAFVGLLVVAAFGFLLALHFLIGDFEDGIEGFEGLRLSVITLWHSALSGELDTTIFQGDRLPFRRQLLLEMFVIVYLSLAALVFVNLLIAQVNFSFEKVATRARQQASANKVHFVHDFSDEPMRRVVGAPMNLFFWFFYLCSLPFMYMCTSSGSTVANEPEQGKGKGKGKGNKKHKHKKKKKQKKKQKSNSSSASLAAADAADSNDEVDFDWYCARCQVYVADEMAKITHQAAADRGGKEQTRLEEIAGNLAYRVRNRDVKNYVRVQVLHQLGRRVCPACMRAKRALNHRENIKYRLAFYVFAALVWVPFWVLASPVLALLWLLDGARRQYRRCTAQDEASRAMTQRKLFRRQGKAGDLSRQQLEFGRLNSLDNDHEDGLSKAELDELAEQGTFVLRHVLRSGKTLALFDADHARVEGLLRELSRNEMMEALEAIETKVALLLANSGIEEDDDEDERKSDSMSVTTTATA